MLLDKARKSKNSDFKSALDAKAAEFETNNKTTNKGSMKHEGGSVESERKFSITSKISLGQIEDPKQ